MWLLESIDALLFCLLLLKIPDLHVNRGNNIMNPQNIYQPNLLTVNVLTFLYIKFI